MINKSMLSEKIEQALKSLTEEIIELSCECLDGNGQRIETMGRICIGDYKAKERYLYSQVVNYIEKIVTKEPMSLDFTFFPVNEFKKVSGIIFYVNDESESIKYFPMVYNINQNDVFTARVSFLQRS